MLCHNLHEELQLIFIMRYKPVVFLYKFHPTLWSHLWLGYLVPTFWPSDSLVDHSMSQGPPLETFDPFSFLGSDVCFLLQNQPSSCLTSLSSGHVWGSSSPSLSSAAIIHRFVIWHLLVKKAKATNSSERYQSWPESLFSAIVPSVQLFTPLNKGV